MLEVKFRHKDYGEMTTTAKLWIECNIFDAVDKNGECHPVNKEDCELIETFEI